MTTRPQKLELSARSSDHPLNFEASVVDDIEHSIEVEHLDSTGQDDIELKIESDDVGFMPEVLNF